jgi:hypothetical protein
MARCAYRCYYLLFHTHFDRWTTLVVRTGAMLTCDRLKRIREATATQRRTLVQRRRGERLERLGLALRGDDVDGVRAMCGLVGRSGSFAIGRRRVPPPDTLHPGGFSSFDWSCAGCVSLW